MTLLAGFDSAWTPRNSGALAEDLVADWQTKFQPDSTVILLDQPTVVRNHDGQRPVERIVSSTAGATLVFETYPVLALISLGWTLPGPRDPGRLPNHDPQRTKTFCIDDWSHVCNLAAGAFRSRGMKLLCGWAEQAAVKPNPRKSDQDCLDACLCLLVALHMAEGGDCLMAGDTQAATSWCRTAPPLPSNSKRAATLPA
jgi:predicted RNase H-like nuclease